MSINTQYTVIATTDRDGLIYTRTRSTIATGADAGTRNAQLHFYKLKIDFQDITQALCDSVNDTRVTEETMRSILRYAHERLTGVHGQVRALVARFDQRGIPPNQRGNARQPEENIDRAQHRGDEHWIRGAGMADLILEASISTHERRFMEASVANLTQELENYDAVEKLRAEGRACNSLSLLRLS